jgi:hypothetical protein
MGRSNQMSVGTTILVSRPFIVTILSHGNIQKGRVQFVFLEVFNHKTIAIFDIYGVRNFRDKPNTWRLILNQNQVVTHNIIGRDFNNLEVVEKMGATRPLLMLKKEATTWHHMTTSMG